MHVFAYDMPPRGRLPNHSALAHEMFDGQLLDLEDARASGDEEQGDCDRNNEGHRV